MKIASFNVNSLRARLPIVLDWLEDRHPDVLCVQETKVQDKDFPLDAFEYTPYQCAFKGQKSYNGVAIFSKLPIEETIFGLDDEPKDEPRLMRSLINGVWIVNSYVPQGYEVNTDKFEYKLQWYRRLKNYFDAHFDPEKDAVVWVGDLNIAYEDRDVHDPDRLRGHVCFHPEVQKLLGEIMKWGFVDVFRKHNDKPEQYTFYDYRMRGGVKRNLGWRLDYVFATKTLAVKSRTCEIDLKPRLQERPSDHTPIIAEFNL